MTDSPTDSPVLQRLRSGTREHHERLERRLDLLDPGLTRADYRRLLERFHGFYGPVEERLAALWSDAAPGFDYERRRKTGALRRDLLRLGSSEAAVDALPRCPDTPALPEFAQALGCTYVLEGATLGGQLISRNLGQLHGIREETGGGFFCVYGSETGRLWREFRQYLTEMSALYDQNAIVAAASETFCSLEAWLCESESSYP